MPADQRRRRQHHRVQTDRGRKQKRHAARGVGQGHRQCRVQRGELDQTLHLSQTMRYGTPLAQAMRVIAAELRSESLVKLEERANRLPALMTVPMMIFIMPTIFMIVGGAAVLQLMDGLLRMQR